MSLFGLDDIAPGVNVRKSEPIAAGGTAVSRHTNGAFPGRMKQGSLQKRFWESLKR